MVMKFIQKLFAQLLKALIGQLHLGKITVGRGGLDRFGAFGQRGCSIELRSALDRVSMALHPFCVTGVQRGFKFRGETCGFFEGGPDDILEDGFIVFDACQD